MTRPKISFFAPEVIQTSSMDCGPASLKCLLEGHGVNVSYGRLREACQTDVDGTSIDTMEEIAQQLGLDAHQIMIPSDHLLLEEAEALPAIVVVRLPNGFTHFLVVWRILGPFIQIMDPGGGGRQWMLRSTFMEMLYKHIMHVPSVGWRQWASGEENIHCLRKRLCLIGVSKAKGSDLIKEALEDETWLSLAALDAAIRMAKGMIDSKAFRKGDEAARLVAELFAMRSDRSRLAERLPAPYWSALSLDENDEKLAFFGCVLVRVLGVNEPPQEEDLPPELHAALSEPQPNPYKQVWSLMRHDGLFPPLLALIALLLSGATALLEVLLYRALLDMGDTLGLGLQRFGGALALVVFFGLLATFHLPLYSAISRLGRHLEVRLREAFLAKIPRIGDRYFQSRPRSDMAERSHSLWAISNLPDQIASMVFILANLVAVTAGVIWLFPQGMVLAICLCLISFGLPLITHPMLAEADLRVRTHAGALSRFYLDGLLGLTPLRAHVADHAIRHQHEKLVTEWSRAHFKLLHLTTGLNTVLALIGTALQVWLVFTFLTSGANTSHALLLIYWVLRLPQLGEEFALEVQQIPTIRNIILRLMEPLGAPDETTLEVPNEERVEGREAVHIQLRDVSVKASGHTILHDLNIDIQPRHHLAIVGPSGAGKSSLVGLLLGWYTASHGELLADGEALRGNHLESLRQDTAWVDPAIQIWNRSFLDNLRYGNRDLTELAQTLEKADLVDLLQRMPLGMQTPLGESGSLVSGGEGQRVRLGRAMLRRRARLVILDEPFRGLDRQTRHRLMEAARELWQDATLICVTHDISETLAFPRVLVIEDGQLVEDGDPQELRNQEGTYARLLHAEEDMMHQVWHDPKWRNLCMTGGALKEGTEASS